MFRVVVAGSRSFQDKELLFSKLDFFLQNRKPEEIEIVSGTARGADTMGEKYAQARGLKVKRFPAEWDRFGKSAGYRRNEQMVTYADALVAFWDGHSPGTRHMISLCKKKGMPMRVVVQKKTPDKAMKPDKTPDKG